jgi:hypothetical protein
VQRSVNECKCANPGGTFDHSFTRGGLSARGTLGHLKRRNDWPSPLLKRKLGKVEFRCFLEICYRLRTFGARALALRPVALIYRPALARGADLRAFRNVDIFFLVEHGRKRPQDPTPVGYRSLTS